MKRLILIIFAAALSSCATNTPNLAQADINGDGVISPTEDTQLKQARAARSVGNGALTKTIRNTASTVGLVRNVQAIFRGF